MFQRTKIKLACALTAKSLVCDFRQVSQNLFPCFQNDVLRRLSKSVHRGRNLARFLSVPVPFCLFFSSLQPAVGEGCLDKHMTDQNARCPLS